MNESLRERWIRWSLNGIRCGTVAGIPLFVHPFLVVLLALLALIALSSGSAVSFALAVLIPVIVFGSVLLHELGHCYGAALMGGGADRIVLGPLGGLAAVRGAERSPYNEFVITLLGPAVTLGLAIASHGIYFAIRPLAGSGAIGGGFVSGALFWLVVFWRIAAYFNWANFFFNMLVPLFPMDCARLIRSLASMRHSPGRVTHGLCLAGLFVAGMMFCAGLASSLYADAVAGFLSEGGYLLVFIAGFGAVECLREMERIRHEDVYTDPYAGRAEFDAATRSLKAFLRIGRGEGAKPRKPQSAAGARLSRPTAATGASAKPSAKKPHGPAKVVEIYSERERLEMELDEAVRREDFVKAAELRDKLRALRETGKV